MVSPIVAFKHASLAGLALGGSYVLPYEVTYVTNLEGVKRQYIIVKSQKQPTVTEQQLTKQQARDIMFLTANLIYETESYPNIEAIQEDAYRVLGTSFINKLIFEKKETFEELVKEKNINSEGKLVCQYSWYCQKGKPVNLDYLAKEYKGQFDIALKMASEIVLGGFVRYAYSETVPFDGVFYCTEEAYNMPKNWHRREVEAKRMCKGRIIDGHIHIAPRAKGTTCKDNQFAFYAGVQND